MTAVLLLALAVFAGLTATTFVETDWRHFVDSAIYLITANGLASGEGYTYLGRPFFVRPPGLSWLLSLFMSGDGTYDFRLYNQIVQLTVAGALGTLLLAMSRLHGWMVGALVTLLFALNPLAVEGHNVILAEYPFMLLFFAAAWLLSGGRDGRQPGWARGLAGAALLAASTYFRTIGVLLLPGLVLLDIMRKEGRRWQGAVLAALVAASLVPWTLYCREAAGKAERPSTQLLMYDYTTALLHTNPSDPDSPRVDLAGWLDRMASNVEEISETTAHAFFGGPANITGSQYGIEATLLTALVAAAMLFTWLSRRSLLDWYMAAYAAVLLVYFTFADRLLLPLLPMAISAVLYSARRLAGLLARPVQAVDPRTVVVAVIALALGGMSLVRLDESRSITAIRNRFYRADRATARWVKASLPADARLLHEKGPIIAVLTGRTTYTYRNLPGPWPEGCPEVDYVIYSPRPRREESEPLVAAVAGPPVHVPFKWAGEQSAIRIYTLGDD